MQFPKAIILPKLRLLLNLQVQLANEIVLKGKYDEDPPHTHTHTNGFLTKEKLATKS